MDKEDKKVFYGFLDESGSPGVEEHKKDYLVVALVLFYSEEDLSEGQEMIRRARVACEKSLDYEFHCNRNSFRVQNTFVDMIGRMSFSCTAVAIKKRRDKKVASYGEAARLLVRDFSFDKSKVKIEMDSNPVLFKELKGQIKMSCERKVKLRQIRSSSSDGVQLADYMVNIMYGTETADDFGILLTADNIYPYLQQRREAFLKLKDEYTQNGEVRFRDRDDPSFIDPERYGY